jgi:hypothetical protein
MLKAENEAEKLKLLEEEIERLEKEKFEEEEIQRMDEEKRKLTALSEATNPDLPTQLEEPVPTNPALPKPDPAKIKSELTDANEKAKVCGTSGSLNISFSLSPDGIIKDLKSIGGTFKDTPTESCILRVYQEHEFPKFSGSSIVVKYTVKL